MKHPACRFCESANTVRAGWRYNRFERKQRWLCKTRRRRFVPDDGTLGLWYPKSVVAQAVDIHFEDLSTRAAERHFKRHHPRWQPSWTSIWRWAQRFGELLRGVLRKLGLLLTGKWCADEMHVRVGGDGWDWEVMHADTRLWLAGEISEGWQHTAEQAERVLGEALTNAGARPSVLSTDGLQAYREGGKWLLGWRRCELQQHLHYREGLPKTNLMERKIQTTRMRVKTMRGFKRGETGQRWLDGFRAFYNFVRPHMAFGTTPITAAGIKLHLGRNTWLRLLSL
ncbi:MAG: DDE-type integrase/transposase/recombinase [Candidatus Hadarchaeales archaeon]